MPEPERISTGEDQHLLQPEVEREKWFAAMERISDAFMDVPLEKLEAEVDRAVRVVRQGRERSDRTHP